MGDNSRDILSKNLLRLLSEYNLSREELSKAIDVPYTTISNWIQGVSYPRANAIDKLTEYFKCQVKDLTSEKDKSDTLYIVYPVIGEIAAGWDSYTFEENKIDEEAIPTEWIKGDDPDAYCVLQIKGNSLYPEIKSGDRVVLHKTSSVPSGSLAAVLYESQYATIKRVIYKQGEDWLELLPLNQNGEYEPIRIEGADLEKCKVVGEVVRLIRRY